MPAPSRPALPFFAMGFTAALATMSACSPRSNPAQTSAPPEILAEGARIYEESCAVCHHDGSSPDPALRLRQASILADTAQLVAIIHSGRQSKKTTPRGEMISVMPAFDYLTDAEISALVSWLRAEYGPSDLGPIDEMEAAKFRRPLVK